MGLIERVFSLVFGSGRNVVAETAEVFRVNAEAQAGRDAGLRGEALAQFGREFASPQRGLFDRVMDAVNRVPRPAMALGTLGLFVAAMVDPVWFAARMTGIALVPEPLWWLLGAIVSFYFGARHQIKGQAFQAQLAQTMKAVPQIIRSVESLEAMRDGTPGVADTRTDAAITAQVIAPTDNAALDDWRRQRAA